MSKHTALRLASLLAVAIFASGASAQAGTDNWLAWQGCWQAEGPNPRPLMCITPDGQGVKVTNYLNGALQSEARLYADNQARPVTQEGCTGTEKAVWSQDGRRLFLRADQVCGQAMQRTVTGLMAMVSNYEILSIQSVTSGGNTGTRTIRYQSANESDVPEAVAAAMRDNRLARTTARTAASGVIELADVREAAANVHTQVVESWITTVGQRFDLDGKTLVGLADAGVQSSLIDVLVAVSYPERFAVAGAEDVTDRTERRAGYGGSASCLDQYWFDPYGFNYAYGYGRYSRYDYGYGDRCARRYGYGGYGFGYGFSPWGYDPYGWRYNNPVIVVVRDPEGGVSDPKATRRGYSAGRSTTGSTTSSGSSSSSGRSSTVGTSSSGSSGSSSGSTGSSTGSSTTTRVAKPRGGN